MTLPLVANITVVADQIADIRISDHDTFATLSLADANHYSDITFHPYAGSRYQDLEAVAEIGRRILDVATTARLAELERGQAVVYGMARLTGVIA